MGAGKPNSKTRSALPVGIRPDTVRCRDPLGYVQHVVDEVPLRTPTVCAATGSGTPEIVPATASVLLDVDGTLVDSNYAHVDAWSKAFAAVGNPVPAWEIHRAIGMGSDKLVAKLVGEDLAERIGEEASDAHDSMFADMLGDVRALPGARDLLAALKQRGYDTVLASSAKADEVEHYIDLLDARGLVDSWTTSADVGQTKPDPELIEVAVDRADSAPIAMIGDSVWDCEAAARAGIPTLALLSGGISASELRDAGAHSVHRDAARLAEVLVVALEGVPYALNPRTINSIPNRSSGESGRPADGD